MSAGHGHIDPSNKKIALLIAVLALVLAFAETLGKSAQTNAEAQYQLGLMLADGTGGAKDEEGARALFEKAAAQNHPAALARMGEFSEQNGGLYRYEDFARQSRQQSLFLISSKVARWLCLGTEAERTGWWVEHGGDRS